jgi:hypothetical protein
MGHVASFIFVRKRNGAVSVGAPGWWVGSSFDARQQGPSPFLGSSSRRPASPQWPPHSGTKNAAPLISQDPTPPALLQPKSLFGTDPVAAAEAGP